MMADTDTAQYENPNADTMPGWWNWFATGANHYWDKYVLPRLDDAYVAGGRVAIGAYQAGEHFVLETVPGAARFTYNNIRSDPAQIYYAARDGLNRSVVNIAAGLGWTTGLIVDIPNKHIAQFFGYKPAFEDVDAAGYFYRNIKEFGDFIADMSVDVMEKTEGYKPDSPDAEHMSGFVDALGQTAFAIVAPTGAARSIGRELRGATAAERWRSAFAPPVLDDALLANPARTVSHGPPIPPPTLSRMVDDIFRDTSKTIAERADALAQISPTDAVRFLREAAQQGRITQNIADQIATSTHLSSDAIAYARQAAVATAHATDMARRAHPLLSSSRPIQPQNVLTDKAVRAIVNDNKLNFSEKALKLVDNPAALEKLLLDAAEKGKITRADAARLGANEFKDVFSDQFRAFVNNAAGMTRVQRLGAGLTTTPIRTSLRIGGTPITAPLQAGWALGTGTLRVVTYPVRHYPVRTSLLAVGTGMFAGEGNISAAREFVGTAWSRSGEALGDLRWVVMSSDVSASTDMTAAAQGARNDNGADTSATPASAAAALTTQTAGSGPATSGGGTGAAATAAPHQQAAAQPATTPVDPSKMTPEEVKGTLDSFFAALGKLATQARDYAKERGGEVLDNSILSGPLKWLFNFMLGAPAHLSNFKDWLFSDSPMAKFFFQLGPALVMFAVANNANGGGFEGLVAGSAAFLATHLSAAQLQAAFSEDNDLHHAGEGNHIPEERQAGGELASTRPFMAPPPVPPPRPSNDGTQLTLAPAA